MADQTLEAIGFLKQYLDELELPVTEKREILSRVEGITSAVIAEYTEGAKRILREVLGTP